MTNYIITLYRLLEIAHWQTTLRGGNDQITISCILWICTYIYTHIQMLFLSYLIGQLTHSILIINQLKVITFIRFIKYYIHNCYVSFLLLIFCECLNMWVSEFLLLFAVFFLSQLPQTTHPVSFLMISEINDIVLVCIELWFQIYLFSL